MAPIHPSKLSTTLACFLLLTLAPWFHTVEAQPSPKVQQRITNAIKSVTPNTKNIDYTEFVNVFIGTDNFGDVWSVSLTLAPV